MLEQDIIHHIKREPDRKKWLNRILTSRHRLLREHELIKNHQGIPTVEELDEMNTKYGREYLNFIQKLVPYSKYIDALIPSFIGICNLDNVMVRAVTQECLFEYDFQKLLDGKESQRDSGLFELLNGKHALDAHKEIYGHNNGDPFPNNIHKIEKCADAFHRYNVFVITSNENPVGVYSIEDKGDGRLYINNIYILPKYRGNGLYSIVLKACANYCGYLNLVSENMYHEIYFVCKPSNCAVYSKALATGFETRVNGDKDFPLQVYKTLQNDYVS